MRAVDWSQCPEDAHLLCEWCGQWIHYGQPYMPRIPFVGSWGGFTHQNCPPRLRLIRGG